MKKILITGISGFVGGHFVHYLNSIDSDWEIHGISRSPPTWDFVPDAPAFLKSHHFHGIDLMDIPKIKSVIEKVNRIISSISLHKVQSQKAGRHRCRHS